MEDSTLTSSNQQIEIVTNTFQSQNYDCLGAINYIITGVCLILVGVYIFKYILYKKSNKNLNVDNDKSLNGEKKEYKKPSNAYLIIAIVLYMLYTSMRPWVLKPIIYIYPEEEMNLSVTLGYPEDITCSYPNYFKNDGWQVKAFPNGDLIDLNTGKRLYSLYWEGKGDKLKRNTEEGFCVKGEETAEFLEEKLELLGLNYKEKEEFIVYWLPHLEKNKYNFIRFTTTEECNQYMPLEIKAEDEGGQLVDANVDNLIRILMIYKPLNHKMNVKEQMIETPSRDGFTVVEWGGSKI